VILNSVNTFADTVGSAVNVSAARGGQNGIVEIFGNGTSEGTIQSSLSAPFSFLVNPSAFTISTDPTDKSLAIPNFNISDLLKYAQISLAASDNIDLISGFTLPNRAAAGYSLSLSAGHNITLYDSCPLTAGNFWDVNLTAGTKLTSSASRADGQDGIYLQ